MKEGENMKELLRLVKDNEAMNLLQEVKNLEESFEAKSFSLEEEEYYKEKQKEMLKRIKEIMKGE